MRQIGRFSRTVTGGQAYPTSNFYKKLDADMQQKLAWYLHYSDAQEKLAAEEFNPEGMARLRAAVKPPQPNMMVADQAVAGTDGLARNMPSSKATTVAALQRDIQARGRHLNEVAGRPAPIFNSTTAYAPVSGYAPTQHGSTLSTIGGFAPAADTLAAGVAMIPGIKPGLRQALQYVGQGAQLLPIGAAKAGWPLEMPSVNPLGDRAVRLQQRGQDFLQAQLNGASADDLQRLNDAYVAEAQRESTNTLGQRYANDAGNRTLQTLARPSQEAFSNLLAHRFGGIKGLGNLGLISAAFSGTLPYAAARNEWSALPDQAKLQLIQAEPDLAGLPRSTQEDVVMERYFTGPAKQIGRTEVASGIGGTLATGGLILGGAAALPATLTGAAVSAPVRRISNVASGFFDPGDNPNDDPARQAWRRALWERAQVDAEQGLRDEKDPPGWLARQWRGLTDSAGSVAKQLVGVEPYSNDAYYAATNSFLGNEGARTLYEQYYNDARESLVRSDYVDKSVRATLPTFIGNADVAENIANIISQPLVDPKTGQPIPQYDILNYARAYNGQLGSAVAEQTKRWAADYRAEYDKRLAAANATPAGRQRAGMMIERYGPGAIMAIELANNNQPPPFFLQ